MMEEEKTHLNRSISSMERDFLAIQSSKLPIDIAREKFERLWDKVGAAAATEMLNASLH
jgi:uncharacterized lipoprotein